MKKTLTPMSLGDQKNSNPSAMRLVKNNSYIQTLCQLKTSPTVLTPRPPQTASATNNADVKPAPVVPKAPVKYVASIFVSNAATGLLTKVVRPVPAPVATTTVPVRTASAKTFR